MSEFGYFSPKAMGTLYIGRRDNFHPNRTFVNDHQKFECDCCGRREDVVPARLCPRMVPELEHSGMTEKDLELGDFHWCPYCRQMKAGFQMMAMLHRMMYGTIAPWVEAYVTAVAPKVTVVTVPKIKPPE